MGPITNGPAQPESSITDASGSFVLNSLPSGTYALIAQQPNYPQNRQVRKKVEVKAGETIDAVTIELTPGGAISGHVVDEDGDPMSGCNVQAHPASHPDHRVSATASADENGEYRLSRLAAGKYLVSLNCFAAPFQPRPFSSGPDPPPSRAYAMQYYQSAADAKSAQAIEVAPGSEKSGVDFQMHIAAVTQIHGKFSPAGADWHGETISPMLIPADPAAPFQPSPVDRDQNKGTFNFPRVFPGSYFVGAVSNGNPENRIGGFVRVEVQDQPVDVVITLSHGVDVNGAVEIENNNNRQVSASQFNLQLIPERVMGLGGPMMNVNEDGTFTLKNVLPASYRLMVQGPGAFVKQALLGAKDVSHGFFDIAPGASDSLRIVLSTNTATITGTAPAGEMVFVENYDSARGEVSGNFFGTAPDQTGHFELKGLAPGKYRLLVVDNGTSPDDVTVNGQDETVGEGEQVTVNLKPPSPGQ